MKMTKRWIVIAALLSLPLAAAVSQAQMAPGYQAPPGPASGGWYCPWCGQPLGPGGYGMGPGMMGPRWGSPYGMMGPGMMMGGGWGGYGMGPGMMGPGMMGPGMMGPGMMGRGWGMGPGMMGLGMMGRGWGMGPGYGQPPSSPQTPGGSKQMEEKDARALLENHLKATRNPNLKLGKIEDKGSVFEAEILTKDGSLVDRIAIDKRTGWMRSVY